MKKIIIILSSIALFLSSCKDSAPSKEVKKAELKDLKSQLITIKSQISKLEKLDIKSRPSEIKPEIYYKIAKMVEVD